MVKNLLSAESQKPLGGFSQILTCNQDTETDSLIPEDFTFLSHILAAWCDEYVMIHYNNNNNAYCRAVNAETF